MLITALVSNITVKDNDMEKIILIYKKSVHCVMRRFKACQVKKVQINTKNVGT